MHKAAENLNYMNCASLPSYSQHKTATKPTTCESIVTNMNNSPRMAPPMPEMVSTASLYNLDGSLNDSNQSHMYNPNDNHQALNPSVYGEPFQPYMPMSYLFKPPNLNRNHTLNSSSQQRPWSITEPTLQLLPIPAPGVQSNRSKTSGTEISSQAQDTENNEDSSQQRSEPACSPSDLINKINTSNIQPQNAEEVFIGARRRRRYQKYFVSNIVESSTRKGIIAHFEQNGVEIHELNLFRGRNDKCYAQVTVDTKYSEKVESDNFEWPDGIFCTYWKASSKRQERSYRSNKN